MRPAGRARLKGSRYTCMTRARRKASARLKGLRYTRMMRATFGL